MNVIPLNRKPAAWTILETAVQDRRVVRARYHARERLLAPHLLGWKNGRAKVLSLQVDDSTSEGSLPADPRHRWRSMFIDEIEDPSLTEHAWQTADNYTSVCNGIDLIEIELRARDSSRTL